MTSPVAAAPLFCREHPVAAAAASAAIAAAAADIKTEKKAEFKAFIRDQYDILEEVNTEFDVELRRVMHNANENSKESTEKLAAQVELLLTRSRHLVWKRSRCRRHPKLFGAQST